MAAFGAAAQVQCDAAAACSGVTSKVGAGHAVVGQPAVQAVSTVRRFDSGAGALGLAQQVAPLEGQLVGLQRAGHG